MLGCLQQILNGVNLVGGLGQARGVLKHCYGIRGTLHLQQNVGRAQPIVKIARIQLYCVEDQGVTFVEILGDSGAAFRKRLPADCKLGQKKD